MNGELVFYTNPMSRGRIVRWMLEEVGQPYRTDVLDFGPPMNTPAYLALNPMGKVPTLSHGDTVVAECAAICAYLADAFPASGLAPAPGHPARGPYYRWLFFAAGPLEAAVTNKAMGFEVPPERKGMVGYGDLSKVLATLEAAVRERDYLVGTTFSAADVYVCSHLNWGMQFGTIERRPEFERYCAGLTSRPAAVRAREMDEALMAKQT